MWDEQYEYDIHQQKYGNSTGTTRPIHYDGNHLTWKTDLYTETGQATSNMVSRHRISD